MAFGRYRNRGMAIRPVHRIKHVIDSQFATIAGTAVSTTLVATVDAPVLATVTQNETGSKVNGIYLHVEAVATTGTALPNFYMYVIKNPGGNLTLPAPNAVGASDNKRYVIHQEMVMFERIGNSNPRTVFNGVIAIPRGYRRNGPNDLITLRVLSPGVACEVCVQCHYKEFR